MAIPKLILMVLAILSGTALTVDAYLDSLGVSEQPGYETDSYTVPLSRDLLPMFEVPRPEVEDTAADSEPADVSPTKSAARRPVRSSEGRSRDVIAQRESRNVKESDQPHDADSRSCPASRAAIDAASIPLDEIGSF